jgi:hypothetical protein
MDAPVSVVVQKSSGYLTPTGVVDADEENLGHVLHDAPSCLPPLRGAALS